LAGGRQGGEEPKQSQPRPMEATGPRETDPLLPQSVDNAVEDSVGHTDKLHRALTARQVTTIALGGAIGTGLFLGTGRSLATGGPGTMLVCYAITGFIVSANSLNIPRLLTQACFELPQIYHAASTRRDVHAISCRWYGFFWPLFPLGNSTLL